MGQKTALIIEDEANLSIIFTTALEAIGFTTEAFLDGRKAQENLATRQVAPDIILLDLHLPFVSGGDLLQQIRSNETFKKTRVMLITADPRKGDEYRKDVDLLLQKPVSIIQLQRLAQRLIE